MAKVEQSNDVRNLMLKILAISLLGGLIPALLALRAKRRGKVVFWWYLLSLIITVGFLILSSFMFKGYSPEVDDTEFMLYYYAIITLIFNAISAFILFIVLFIHKPII